MSANDDWERHEVTVPGSAVESTLANVVYGGGVWHGTGWIDTGSTVKFASATATADAPEAWTLSVATVDGGELTDASVIANLALAYGDGKLVASGKQGTANVVIVNADPPDGDWTKSSWTSDALDSIVYFGGEWVGATNAGKVYSASNPTGTWTLEHDFYTSGTAISALRLAVLNGDLVLVYRQGTYHYAYSATDPGTWTARGSYQPYSQTNDMVIGYGPDGYFVQNISRVYYRPTLTTGSWTQAFNLADVEDDLSPSFLGPVFGDGDYVVSGVSNYKARIYTSASLTSGFSPGTIETVSNDSIGLPVFGSDTWVAPGFALEGGLTKPIVWVPAAGGTGWGLLL